MANKDIADANIIIEEELKAKVAGLGGIVGSDILTFRGLIGFGAEDVVLDIIESTGKKKRKLVVILTTLGGYIEVVQRIVDIIRHHYRMVEFIIPDHALSAGTVLVMSGDAIHMDYYSILGPIDPQVSRRGVERMIPALGYLKQYERLIEKSRMGILTTAELNILVEKFDPAELYSFEQSRELSITLLKEWLVKYKFKSWKQTQTRKLKVTKAMKEDRASKIAEILNDTDKWHSHTRGISMKILRRDLKLQIEDFEKDDKLSDEIRSYHRLLTDYMGKRGSDFIIQTGEQFIGLRAGVVL